jgi:hypothetical protein
MCVGTIDIKSKNRLLKVGCVPATSTTFLAFFSFFLMWPLTVLMKQTRQAVHAIKQSILLRCLWLEYQNHHLRRDIWWLNFKSTIKYCAYFQLNKKVDRNCTLKAYLHVSPISH